MHVEPLEVTVEYSQQICMPTFDAYALYTIHGTK